VRERDKALAMGTAAGYGRYVTLACPAYNNAVIALVPMGAFSGWASVVAIMRASSGGDLWVYLLFIIPGLAMSVLCLGGAAWFPYARRPGGPTPRLYCFEDGVVVAELGVLRPFRWSEISIASHKWQSGSGETYDYGVKQTVRAPDGSVLVNFSGEEADRAHAYEMTQLHQAALQRGFEDTPGRDT
jgi:hypothetical protein